MATITGAARDAEVYGPVCMAVEERGLAAGIFAALRARPPGRGGVTLIRRNNQAWLGAHEKRGMREVAGLDHNGVAFVVLTWRG